MRRAGATFTLPFAIMRMATPAELVKLADRLNEREAEAIASGGWLRREWGHRAAAKVLVVADETLVQRVADDLAEFRTATS